MLLFDKLSNLFFNLRKPITRQKNQSISTIQSQEAYEIKMPCLQKEEPPFLSAISEIPFQNNYEGYFKNGGLYDVNPRNKAISLDDDRQVAYSARFIISDNVKYDLNDAESIANIKIPDFSKATCFLTGNLAYIIRMKAKCEYRPAVAVPLIYKAASLMINSSIGWNKKDYFRLVAHLWSIGEFEYGDYLLDELNKKLPFMVDDNYYKKVHFERELQLVKEFKRDYLEIGHLGSICSECAIYQDRIYSISGNDTRFPKLPQFIIDNCGLHCGNSIDACIYHDGMEFNKYIYTDYDTFTIQKVDAMEYSNRPFVDMQSDIDKMHYENWIDKKRKAEEADAKYYSREYWISKYYDRAEYNSLKLLLGDKAPKSFAGYRRMKKSNSANFQKLLKFAKENNININS